MPLYQKSEEKLVISFSGNLNTVTCIDLENGLFEKIENSECYIIFDLKEVSTISSMFLRICTKTLNKSGKEKFSIINVPEAAMKVFNLTHLDRFLNVSA